jgi:hypothetical protein
VEDPYADSTAQSTTAQAVNKKDRGAVRSGPVTLRRQAPWLGQFSLEPVAFGIEAVDLVEHPLGAGPQPR